MEKLTLIFLMCSGLRAMDQEEFQRRGEVRDPAVDQALAKLNEGTQEEKKARKIFLDAACYNLKIEGEPYLSILKEAGVLDAMHYTKITFPGCFGYQ